MWCFAKDRKNNECRNHATKDGRFCKLHDYMADYTDEMIEQSIICSGCKKMHYNNDNTKTCDKCKYVHLPSGRILKIILSYVKKTVVILNVPMNVDIVKNTLYVYWLKTLNPVINVYVKIMCAVVVKNWN